MLRVVATMAATLMRWWIDSCGDDKRHLTPLMRAAKLGRLGCVAALIDQHGAAGEQAGGPLRLRGAGRGGGV
jgi:hypothetical protein